MSAYLVGEDGPHTGVTITFENGEEWILGRDPDLCYFALEDPMVSRKHALLRFSEEGYFLENLSTINPILVNGSSLQEPIKLKEDDLVQIGNSFFRFTETLPVESAPLEGSSLDAPFAERIETEEPLSKLPFFLETPARWILKVISGPNQGAEFGMNLSETHIIGKDPDLADIIFQDLSVSRQHAKIEISKEGDLFIADMGSRNGVFVNGAKIDTAHAVHSQDIISLGTTSFCIIDRESLQETIYSPAAIAPEHPPEEEVSSDLTPLIEESPKEAIRTLFIPTRHLIFAGFFGLCLLVACVSFLALFRSHAIVTPVKNESKEIQEILKPFPSVQFTFNSSSGKIFLIGHVLTTTEHNELIYLIKTLPFIQNIDDNVVIDEGVWDNMNALLITNPNWRGVMVTATKPGRFVIRGYVQNEEEASRLQEYMNLNFSYLNLIDNQVVVENTLQAEIQSMLIERGYLNVTFQSSNGEIIFAGRVSVHQEKAFEMLLAQIRKIPGVRQARNFVIFTGESTARVDLTSRYQVAGTSKYGDTSQYVLINGRILAKGDLLDGMIITGITGNEIQLDKDGIKYKIDYNQQ